MLNAADNENIGFQEHVYKAKSVKSVNSYKCYFVLQGAKTAIQTSKKLFFILLKNDAKTRKAAVWRSIVPSSSAILCLMCAFGGDNQLFTPNFSASPLDVMRRIFADQCPNLEDSFSQKLTEGLLCSILSFNISSCSVLFSFAFYLQLLIFLHHLSPCNRIDVSKHIWIKLKKRD